MKPSLPSDFFGNLKFLEACSDRCFWDVSYCFQLPVDRCLSNYNTWEMSHYWWFSMLSMLSRWMHCGQDSSVFSPVSTFATAVSFNHIWKTIACEVKRNCGRDISSNEANITKGMPCVFSYNTHPQKGTFGIVMLACQGIINAFATAFLSEISPIDAPIPKFTLFTPRAQLFPSWASGRSWDRKKDCESLEYQQTRRVYMYIYK